MWADVEQRETAKMLSRAQRTELLATEIFANLNHSATDQLLAELQFVHLPGGATLFHAGDHGDCMYVVLSGRLRVLLEAVNGSNETLRELSRGDSVGELALLTDEPRSATIRAIRDSELARLTRASFERVIRSDPTLLRRIAVQVAVRQRLSTEKKNSGRNVRTIALLSAVHSIKLDKFGTALSAALALIGPTKRLHSGSFTSSDGFEGCKPGAEPPRDDELSICLDEIEASHRTIIYQADAAITPWTKRCIRQADLILVIDRSDGTASERALTHLREFLKAGAITARIELVLLHERDSLNHGAGLDRLSKIGAATQHHVIPSDSTDFARLARLLTGNATGLVLSGGGARGFAHIGVIRALHEAGIPIDFIGGTSMGAVIAAQYALGWDWQTMARVNREEWPRCEPQKNYTLPLVALNSARRMDEMLRRMFGTAEIQDLRRNFFCVSTNLTAAAPKIHRQGLVWKAVRASVSIPGIGPPAIENGEILVDGGLVDNLPVETMKQLCPGSTYAVDVSEQVEFTSKLNESYTVSGWKLLWQQLSRAAEKPDIPNILNTLYRTTTVAGIRSIESAKAQADLCFEPPVNQFGVFDWKSVEKIIDLGYHYALGKLATSRCHVGNTTQIVRW
jgi:predicted acylesterase/phospholipase RssA/CRP-like cAMP-binding protein